MKKILFVCHGNICRSLMAEAMLKKLVRDKGVDIASDKIGNPLLIERTLLANGFEKNTKSKHIMHRKIIQKKQKEHLLIC